MSNVKRVYVEKKPAFAVEATGLYEDLKENLGLPGLTSVRVLNRYDVEGVSDEVYHASLPTIFSEPQVDELLFTLSPSELQNAFAVEYLPGQYDQRADSCEQCIGILSMQERPRVRTAKLYLLEGSVSPEELQSVKAYLINPVECREASFDLPNTLAMDVQPPAEVETVAGFTAMSREALADFLQDRGLAMDFNDLLFCQQYFRDEEKRDPTITEIKILDTYWSDHCRHTTFNTEIQDVTIQEPTVRRAYENYLMTRVKLRRKKPESLMDIGTLAAKALKAAGKLPALDESEEINACSVCVDAEIDGKTEPWLFMFKNETHNHPTEIEPFGGAATCLGGAIRDPLSGRSYVYQAMRVTGAADPRVKNTLPGKLPQRKIVTQAAAGYSSYGNQIGLATGQVTEIYHPGYVAKRMEVGAVLGAAPKENVVRERPVPGDQIILLGGRTGRDGIGGATGSSKSHTLESLAHCGAEVQKGNPPQERKIQRLFRNPEVTRLIKRCNDFGAGGVCVAVGELADGLSINLDKVSKKYEGLDGTELAISESQERMAVVVAKSDTEAFLRFAEAENLEAAVLAEVTDQGRMVMTWNGRTIVDLSRAFIDTNGASRRINIDVPAYGEGNLEPLPLFGDTVKDKLEDLMGNLNICSQKGLVERFDSSIGASSVMLPYGGKTQNSPTQYMAALLPALGKRSNTASLLAFGFDPALSSKNPYHGAAYAVCHSVAKLIAAGGSMDQIWLSFQEYFEKLGQDKTRWAKPFSALLGAFDAQMGLEVAAIGGKDSMSGSFMDIDVPPTLISFAAGVAPADRLIPNHFIKPGSRVVLARLPLKKHHVPDFAQAKEIYESISALTAAGKVLSSYAIGLGGVAEAVVKMGFGNRYGFTFDGDVDLDTIFNPGYGSILLELADGASCDFEPLGAVTAEPVIAAGNETVSLDSLLKLWEEPLEKIFPVRPKHQGSEPVEAISWDKRTFQPAKLKTAKPKVLIPVFPGTNCEYDTKRPFDLAGADAEIFVFNNLDPAHVTQSLRSLSEKLKQTQIFMLPGGFSGGDEPDGSGKFIATVLRNPMVSQEIMELIQARDGLILGICNGFQALVKVGLLPFGEIRPMDYACPTLTYNLIGRHQSRYVNTRIASVNSPWLSRCSVGDIHSIPVSHGEGRFVASDEVLQTMIKNGQIATQYVDDAGNPAMDIRFNPNGSVLAIEGILSPDGRVFGKMGHSERIGELVGRNIAGDKDQQLFLAGVEYFR